MVAGGKFFAFGHANVRVPVLLTGIMNVPAKHAETVCKVGRGPHSKVYKYAVGREDAFAQFDVDLSWEISLAVGDVGI